MSTAEITVNGNVLQQQPRSWQHRIVARVFRSVEKGQLTVNLKDGTRVQINAPQPGPSADISLHSLVPVVFALWWKGDVGFAESHMSGRWDTSDLSQLMYFLSVNLEALSELERTARETSSKLRP